MDTSKHEFLSALLDDEAGEFERRRLLNELSRDNESGQALGQTLNRYALVGEAMRAKQNLAISDSSSFLAGIHAGLEDEPEYNETVVQFADNVKPDSVKRWRNNNVLRFGMAASVAIAAVVGVLWLQSGNQPTSTESMAANGNDTVGSTIPSASVLQTAQSDNDGTVGNDSVRRINLVDSSRIRQGNQHMDRETRDALKQYVTLHMQHRANNSIITSIQASAYSK